MSLDTSYDFYNQSVSYIQSRMLSILNARVVLGLFILFTFHPHFIEMSSNFQPEVQVKNIGDKNYVVKTSFSTFSSTLKPNEDRLDYDNEFDLDDSFNPLCSDIEFECADDHQCIPIESYCNDNMDCADGSDESTCARIPKIFTEMMTTSNNITIILLMIAVMISCKIYGGVKFLYMKVTHR